MNIAVIGGTGMGQLLLESSKSQATKQTRATNVGGGRFEYYALEINDHNVYFVDRHHTLGQFCLPHQLILHRAQQRYLAYLATSLKVTVVLATSAVGAIRDSQNIIDPQVGDLYCPTDAIDYTGLPFTFSQYCPPHSTKFHRSSEDLFCKTLAKFIVSASDNVVKLGGNLGSTLQGPRFETKAEIEKYRRDGVDFLSMSTCFPEAILARELGLSYGLIACVSNLCPELDGADGAQVAAAMAQQKEKLLQTILATIRHLDAEKNILQNCFCQRYQSVFEK